MEKLKCQKCQHEWLPRVTYVKECPKCKSRIWNTIEDNKEISEDILEDNKELERASKEENVLEIEDAPEDVKEVPEIKTFICPECKNPVEIYQDCNNCGAELIWKE